MSEFSYQQQTTYGGQPAPDPAESMGAAADDFRRSVQEASERLSSAGSQLVSMSQELAAAIAEARQAAEQAKEAQRKAEETQQQMQRDYGAVSDLVRDLQDRISALATLARPMPAEPRLEAPAQAYGGSDQEEVAADSYVQGPSEGQSSVQPESQPWPSRSW